MKKPVISGGHRAQYENFSANFGFCYETFVLLPSRSNCRVMGILNVTPDSFSDGGRYATLESAVARAFAMVDEGADLIDVGGESTRPGAPSVSEDEELSRVLPLLRALRREGFSKPVSLDTAKPSVARKALDEGLVSMLNDVGGLRDPAMVDVVRAHGCPAVMMHMFGDPRTMQQAYRYDDVVTDLVAFFERRIEETGLREQLILDPGLGFGKSVEHNLAIISRLGEFKALGFPILVGASRKSFIGAVLDVPVEERLEGSLAIAAMAVERGADMLRVHDVRETRRVVTMTEALLRADSAR